MVQNQKKMYFIDKRFKIFLRMRFAFVYRQNLFVKQKFIFNFFFFLDLKKYWLKKYYFLKNLDLKKNNIFFSSILPFFLFEKQFLFKKIELNEFLVDKNISYFVDKNIYGNFFLSNDLNFIKSDEELSIFFKKFNNKDSSVFLNIFDFLNQNFFFFNQMFFFLNILEIYKIVIILYINLNKLN